MFLMKRLRTLSKRWEAMIQRSMLLSIAALLLSAVPIYGALEGIHWLLYRRFY